MILIQKKKKKKVSLHYSTVIIHDIYGLENAQICRFQGDGIVFTEFSYPLIVSIQVLIESRYKHKKLYDNKLHPFGLLQRRKHHHVKAPTNLRKNKNGTVCMHAIMIYIYRPKHAWESYMRGHALDKTRTNSIAY